MDHKVDTTLNRAVLRHQRSCLHLAIMFDCQSLPRADLRLRENLLKISPLIDSSMLPQLGNYQHWSRSFPASTHLSVSDVWKPIISLYRTIGKVSSVATLNFILRWTAELTFISDCKYISFKSCVASNGIFCSISLSWVDEDELSIDPSNPILESCSARRDTIARLARWEFFRTRARFGLSTAPSAIVLVPVWDASSCGNVTCLLERILHLSLDQC